NMVGKSQATIEDLYQVKGKAELVGGEIVVISPAGVWPSRAAGTIYISLSDYERKTKSGLAFIGSVAYHVSLPNRESFCPAASWHTGRATGMKFLEGAPAFAAEVRSEDDYGPRAEERLAEKRRDYFAAGTMCVWDVDLLSPDVIKAYHSFDPDNPIIFRRGEK